MKFATVYLLGVASATLTTGLINVPEPNDAEIAEIACGTQKHHPGVLECCATNWYASSKARCFHKLNKFLPNPAETLKDWCTKAGRKTAYGRKLEALGSCPHTLVALKEDDDDDDDEGSDRIKMAAGVSVLAIGAGVLYMKKQQEDNDVYSALL